MLRRLGGLLLALGLLFVAYLFWQAGQSETPKTEELTARPEVDKTVIAYGSCNREDRDQGYWPVIAAHRPDAWLWLGDNVYADSPDTAVIAAAYRKLRTNEYYREFLATVPTVYGIWDDHDYGSNDAGAEWAIRAESRNLMLDFLDVPEEHPVRSREGGYQAYTIGEGNRQIRVLLLDTRYFRDEFYPPTEGQRYGPNPEGDILGEAQWAWLREELTDSEAAVHLIGSSIQVLSAEHPYEKWANFPRARRRLLELLEETRPARPLLLSGDRHVAELSRLTTDAGYSIYDFTASGLTHAYTAAAEDTALRVSPLIGERNYGLLTVVWGEGGPRLLAESRSVEDDRTFFAGEIVEGGEPNTGALTSLVYTKDTMPNRLKPCPDSPNCVSTQTDQEDKLRDPIPFTGSVEEARQRIRKIVEAMPRTVLLAEEDNYLHFSFRTFPIPFTDDVEFLIDEQNKVVHYRSASRVGHSDLGVNGRRMAKVVEAIGAL